MAEKYLSQVGRCHFKKIQAVITYSDILRQEFVVPNTPDQQGTKLMLALDTRRLAEILAVYDAWTKTYCDDEKFFHDVAYNDLVDIIGRMKNVPDGSPMDEGAAQKILDMLPAKRFKLRYRGANGKTNEDLRREAAADFQFIFFVTSKILHADEYSTYNHCVEDKLGWPSLIMAGDLACKIYRTSPLSKFVQN